MKDSMLRANPKFDSALAIRLKALFLGP